MVSKRVDDSRTEHVQIIMPAHVNGYDRLFGGRLMEWIDVVAGVVARRHGNRNITTARVDSLEFKSAAYADSTVVLKGHINWVGRTSMEVQVDTFVESLDGRQDLINRAYLVVVALDEHERPVAVPRLELVSPEDTANWEAGERRNQLRKQRIAENY